MNESSIVFAIIGAMVVLFIADLIPAGFTAMGTALALYASGVLSLREALGGFGDPVVPFVASLTMVSASLEATGIAAWAGEALAGQAGESRTRLLVLSMLAAGLLTAFIGPSGAVAAMLPVVILVAVRIGKSPSRLLMPMVFAAQADSMLLLTVSLVNLIASEEGEAVGLAPFSYFEITRIGIPALAGTIAIVLLFGDRLVPQRTSRLIPADLSRYPGTLARQYNLFDDIVSLEISPGSPLIGQPPSAIDIRNNPELSLIAIQATRVYGRKSILAAGDRLLVRGEEEAIRRFAGEQRLTLGEKPPDSELRRSLFSPASGFAEVLIPPRSGLVGQKMFPGMVTPSGELVVLAIQRRGEPTGPGETVLAAGDTLLLRGSWKALDQHLADPDVLSVYKPDAVRRQAVPMGAGAKRAIAVLIGMILLLATGAVPAVVAALLAAAASFLTPVASGVNMMIQGPGGYRFGDYWKLGLPLTAWFFLLAVLLVPAFWSFSPPLPQ